MRISLIHNPYFYQEFMENLEFVSNNFGTFPPLGLMYVSSILKNEGHETDIIDVKAEDLSKEDIFKRIENFDADIVGIMVIPFTAKISLNLAEEIKEKFDLPIVAGNYALCRYPEAVLSNEFIDYGIVGSARRTLPKLLEEIKKENKNLEKTEGLAFRKEGSVTVNYPDEITEELNKLPFPDRESIDNSDYSSMASKERRFTIMITSYGCTYDCSFCDMGSFGYRERDPKDVVDEMEKCVEEYGIKEIDIFDRDFLINKKRSKKICKEVIDRNLGIKWSCRTRVDQVDKKILRLMRKAGCRLILYGVESGNQEILDKDHKGITLQEIERAIKLTKEVGIETLGFFIIGHPDETEEQIRETIEFSKKLPLDYAQFFLMSGKPGAKLYEEVKEELGYDYFDKLIRGEVKERDLLRPWVELDNKEIKKWVLEAYKEFYLRPEYILKRFRKLQSFSEFKRYVKVGTKILKKTIIP